MNLGALPAINPVDGAASVCPTAELTGVTAVFGPFFTQVGRSRPLPAKSLSAATGQSNKKPAYHFAKGIASPPCQHGPQISCQAGSAALASLPLRPQQQTSDCPSGIDG